MQPALARKPQESKSPAASEPKKASSQPAEGAMGAPAGMPLFLRQLQAKLEVNEPGDAWEWEADGVASAVMRKEVPGACPACASAGRTCSGCAKEEEPEVVQRKPAAAGPAPAGDTVPVPDSGAPLSGAVRERIEPVLGADLGGVRVHSSPAARESARSLRAKAFTHRDHIWLGPGQSADDVELMAHEATHVVQQTAGPGPAAGAMTVQRKKGADGEAAAGGDASGTKGPDESKTPSDQSGLADGYKAREGEEGRLETPDGRVVSREQALAESRVINSEGIFMGAYLARYHALSQFKLGEIQERLSEKAGFMKQFKTGDVVLRQMNAADSQGLAKVTESNYSHSGIIQVKGGRVWVLDSYPGRKGAAAEGGFEEDSSTVTRFEDFFSDQHGEKIVQGLVLRVEGMNEEIRQNIDKLIEHYRATATTFDRDFRIDNGEFVLYCSELVFRILKEAGSPELPPNEFEKTVQHARELIEQLKAFIALQKSQGQSTKESEEQLGALERLVAQAGSAAPELYSPGSLERAIGLKSITGFTADGEVTGTFDVVIASATLPADSWDTPDAFVKVSAGLLSGGKTSVKADTTTPKWNETVVALGHKDLRSVHLEVWDEDVISNDLLASFQADLRPVRPKGQRFHLADSAATLEVDVKGQEKDLETKQAPRE